MFHLLFWIFSSFLVILALEMTLFFFPGTAVKEGFTLSFTSYVVLLFFTLTIGASLFYASYFSLNFFLKKTSRFFWIALGYVIFITFLIIDSNYIGLTNEPKRIDILSIFATTIPILYFNILGFLFRTFIEWIQDRKIKAELEKDKIESQLELLKSKLNPHFLFNTLNNIDILIIDQPNKASEYLKKLSELLRFMLFETNAEFIPLSKEIDYIKEFVDLQKIRTANDDYVDLQIFGDYKEKSIAPMIFVHFIENAFKFASNKKIKNAISVKFDISDRSVSFICKNHIHPTDLTAKENKNGIGIKLIQQRLDLIYKKAYNLSIVEKDNFYIVNLDIKLTND